MFAPYTDIPTNLLFFDTSGPTKDIWYYEHAAAGGPQEIHEDRADAVRGVRGLPGLVEQSRGERARLEGLRRGPDPARRAGSRRSPATSTSRIPHSGEVADHRAPAEIVDAIIAQEQRILGIMDEIKAALGETL